jgi:hypothetical protein
LKINRFFTAVMAALIALVFSVLAGCASTGAATGGVTPDPAAAARLAKAINAVKAGSAKASGGTVTLSGEVWLQKDLAVSAGVILDLTADGAALGLKDGAVLTVNGTVNARGHGDHGNGWVDGGLRVDNGATAVNGSGTIRLAGKGRLLNVWGGNGRKLTLEGVTLVGLPDNDQSLVGAGDGGTLVMKSGAITGNTYIDDDWAGGGGVEIGEGGAFTMEGGEISGNSAKGKRGGSGGGVQVWKGTFTMKDGVISDNTAQGSEGAEGGGVRVEKGTFTVEGGEISGNSVTGTRAYGGGVQVGEESVFTMEGGAISGNSVNGSMGASGGGVFADKGSVSTMKDGAISGNSATGKEWANGGGVIVNTGGTSVNTTFTMSGGIISGNNAGGREAKGGGVKVQGGIFTMKGGTISGNSASGSALTLGGGVMVDEVRDGETVFTMLGGTIYGSASAANAGDNANETRNGSGTLVTGRGAALNASTSNKVMVKWGAGGTYTKGGVSQAGGSVILAVDPNRYTVGTDDTLIAIPVK